MSDLRKILDQIPPNISMAKDTRTEWEKMADTREWLIESEGYTADELWPEWYPPNTPPPWYNKMLDNGELK